MFQEYYVNQKTIMKWIYSARDLWEKEYGSSLRNMVEFVSNKSNVNNPPGLITHMLNEMKKDRNEGYEIQPFKEKESGEVIPSWMNPSEEELNLRGISNGNE